jgi:hypothetical protein
MRYNDPSLFIAESKTIAPELADKATTDNHGNFIAGNIVS